MSAKLNHLPKGKVKLLPGLFQQRLELNRAYMLSLTTPNLLQNFYLEAGLWQPRNRAEHIHLGWEAPTCQLRGHFLGHWLSGAAYLSANTADAEMKGKADYIVSELARCQIENGGEWVGSIPEKYLDWAACGKRVWAPHYTLHKTLMGLWDMYAVGGNAQALDILVRWARWFSRWTGQFNLEQMDNILEVETGGMLEVWANLYGVTGEKEHYELIQRYDRRRLFDPLLDGVDVLTNMHMNTTIPEVHGAARAWEVTGEERWRKIVDAYWRMGVTERGYYASGGQTNGEVWSPPNELASRMGFRTQEHCTVYNMMRLADYMLRWTGDAGFGDYWERNLWNGILAQQHPDTGMIAYFLPMFPGAEKVWGTPTEDFWCCHGSLVQAHTIYANHIWYAGTDGLTLSQYIPSETHWELDGNSVSLRLSDDPQIHQPHRPQSNSYNLTVEAQQACEFTLRLRLPWWVGGPVELTVNGAAQDAVVRDGYIELSQVWSRDAVHLTFPKTLTAVPLPDESDVYAFMDGPVVLAGLNPGGTLGMASEKAYGSKDARPNYRIDGIRINGDAANPASFLSPDNEREWTYWRGDYRTRCQAENFRLIPLHEVRDEAFTLYFPVSKE